VHRFNFEACSSLILLAQAAAAVPTGPPVVLLPAMSLQTGGLKLNSIRTKFLILPSVVPRLNSRYSTLKEPQTPQALALDSIGSGAARAFGQSGLAVLFAGTPLGKTAPAGMREILSKGGHSGLGVAGGLTLVKNAAAFVAPTFSVRASHERTGYQVNHFAVINRTTSEDVEHESFFPSPGNHLRPGMSQQINGRNYNHYWKVAPAVSDLIRQGEQEHLDDARRAYELTYKLIAERINALAGSRFGPATTPAGAQQQALDALATQLPRELGTDPANWPAVLDRLLKQTEARDTNAWHALSIDPPQTVGDMILDPVVTTGTTRIGRVPSSQVVNY
jgi:hypothetical protein